MEIATTSEISRSRRFVQGIGSKGGRSLDKTTRVKAGETRDAVGSKKRRSHRAATDGGNKKVPRRERAAERKNSQSQTPTQRGYFRRWVRKGGANPRSPEEVRGRTQLNKRERSVKEAWRTSEPLAGTCALEKGREGKPSPCGRAERSLLESCKRKGANTEGGASR